MQYNRTNKFMRYCFAGMALAFSMAIRAQSVYDAPPAPALRTSSVVRADVRTGRLVRTVVVAPHTPVFMASYEHRVPEGKAKTAGKADFQPMRDLVNREVDGSAIRYGIDPLLVHSVIRVESNYNPVAVSPKGAEGLMQLIPATARRFGVSNSFDVHENIDAGVRYLKYLLDLFGDDRLAVAAYNAGESAVLRYGNVPPYPETVDYVYRVAKARDAARQHAPEAMPAPVPQIVPSLPVAREVESYMDGEGRICMRTR
jgi:soluble lytic murein transglycosylase-like protein